MARLAVAAAAEADHRGTTAAARPDRAARHRQYPVAGRGPAPAGRRRRAERIGAGPRGTGRTEAPDPGFRRTRRPAAVGPTGPRPRTGHAHRAGARHRRLRRAGPGARGTPPGARLAARRDDSHAGTRLRDWAAAGAGADTGTPRPARP